ncbi:hypothetical protein ACCC88_01105 [Sphingomonas sp. Sphisp140]|uniref:hypothetical protein n=1 Tax=unclassified Sphingomonas TaxID=196159 RepID=UPI0039B0A78D
MTQLYVFAGSLGAILVMTLAAWALGLGRGAAIASAEEARETAEGLISGFDAGEALLGSDGRAALVHGKAGDVALLKMHGARVAVRHLRLPLTSQTTPDGLRVDSGDRRFGAVLLRGVTGY